MPFGKLWSVTADIVVILDTLVILDFMVILDIAVIWDILVTLEIMVILDIEVILDIAIMLHILVLCFRFPDCSTSKQDVRGHSILYSICACHIEWINTDVLHTE